MRETQPLSREVKPLAKEVCIRALAPAAQVKSGIVVFSAMALANSGHYSIGAIWAVLGEPITPKRRHFAGQPKNHGRGRNGAGRARALQDSFNLMIGQAWNKW